MMVLFSATAVAKVITVWRPAWWRAVGAGDDDVAAAREGRRWLMTANPGGRSVSETDMTTTRRPRSVARDQSGQHQEDVIHPERTMLTHLGADDISMWVLRKDNLDDGRLLRIDAARVETFGSRSADRSPLGSPNGR